MTQREFLRSMYLFEQTRGFFFKKRYWCYQSIHYPCTHISMMDADWLESLSEEMIKKVVTREANNGYQICTVRALQDD